MLEDFLNHRILIRVYQPTEEQLLQLEELTGKTWCDGVKLCHHNPWGDGSKVFLHCDLGGFTWSYNTQIYSFVELEDFLKDYSNNFEITEDEMLSVLE